MDAFGRSNPKIVPVDLEGNLLKLYSRISRGCTHSFLFESLTGPEELAETSVMGVEPKVVLRGYSDRLTVEDGTMTKEIPTKDPLNEVRQFLRSTDERSYRYMGGAVGVVNYDAVPLWEKVPARDSTPEPLIEFGVYDDGILYDNRRGKAFYFYYDKDRYVELLDREPTTTTPAPFVTTKPRPSTGTDEFVGMVERAKRLIHDGDIFQVVLSRRFTFDVAGDSLVAYRKLRRLNPSPYMYHLRQGSRTVVGSSPEMLIRVTGETAETFPIAGTRRITGDEAEDRRLGAELLRDEKELAEHTMLVDLGRNDIGRVCRYGSVCVPSLMEVKQFSHVQHMVTHVVGTLSANADMFDAFKAVFPAGTVTGAPKVRAMEIIGELEAEPRGRYAGAVGYFSYNMCCDFAIAIRSIFIDGKNGYVQSGAGIVADSRSESELQETEQKASAMLQALREASR